MDQSSKKEQSATEKEPVIRIEGHERIHTISMWEGHEDKRIPVHIEVKKKDESAESDIIIKP